MLIGACIFVTAGNNIFDVYYKFQTIEQDSTVRIHEMILTEDVWDKSEEETMNYEHLMLKVLLRQKVIHHSDILPLQQVLICH